MASIRESVGKGGSNRRDDVTTIQTYLNAGTPGRTSVVVTGICDVQTMLAIQNFQRSILFMSQLDPEFGRVAPISKTFSTLSARAGRKVDSHVLFPQTSPPGAVTTPCPESGTGFYSYPKEDDPRYMRARKNKYARRKVIDAIFQLGKNWNAKHPDIRIGIGDLSLFGGNPDFGRHPAKGHPDGLVIDIRPMRKDGRELPISYQDRDYGLELTQELVDMIFQLGGVKKIVFNDSRIKNGNKNAGSLGHDKQGGHAHDNHLHVELDGYVYK